MHFRTTVESALETRLKALYAPAIEVREKGLYPIVENERQIIWDIEEDVLTQQDADENVRELKILLTVFAPTKAEREAIIVDVDADLTVNPPGGLLLWRLDRVSYGIQTMEESLLFGAEMEYRGSVCVKTGDLTGS